MDAVDAVTWNVAGLDETDLDERTEAQCFALLLDEPRPDVLLLQEVVHRSWHAHWKHHLHHANYRVLPEDPTTDSEYFSLIAVQRAHRVTNSGVQPFVGSQMGRQLLWVEVNGWWVSTGHLESGRACADERIRQLDTILCELTQRNSPAFFGGDTNLRIDEEPRIARLHEVTDAWQAVGAPASLRTTWRAQGHSARARFDRIFVNAHAEVKALSAIRAQKRLSDHTGLRMTLCRVP